MMNKKLGFTFSEMLITMGIMAVILTILIPAVKSMQPNQSLVMFKKAYQITERAVGELVNDESVYPYDPEAFGFYNKEAAMVEGTNIEFEGDLKFCCFFARKLNVYADPAVCENASDESEVDSDAEENPDTDVSDASPTSCEFQTTDSISWIVESDFNKDNKSSVQITVDVNGSEAHNGKGPNTNADVPNRDVYNIFVDFDGRVRVTGAKEIEFLRSHTPNKR